MANNLRANITKLVELERARNRHFKPVIVTDIDGVLVRGGNPIPQTLEALRIINQRHIPFACLTNGGGQLEAKKSHKLDIIFGEKLFCEDTMFMNHTPLKPKLVEYSKKAGNLLITGSLNVKEIVESLDIRNYITADEFYSIYMLKEGDNRAHDYFFDYVLHRRDINQELIKEEVEYRLGRKLGTFKEESQLINSFFALNDVSPYEVALRVIHNILLVKSTMTPVVQMQYYAAQNDITWASSYARPRMAFGPFNYILQNHCKKHNFKLLEHVHYGKPQKKAFEFVQEQMLKREPEGVFFMIGDNPRADIKGANTIGWYSFLTKTGIHTKDTNDQENPATFLVSNFHEAILTIIEASKQLC